MTFENLSKAEAKTARRIAKQLRDVGLDPDEKHALLLDYVLAETRITGLRQQEKVADGRDRLVAMRGLNVALAERRRLYEALFKGARRRTVRDKQLQVVVDNALDETAADAAWRKFFHAHDSATRTAEEIGRQGIALERLHGEPSWAAIMYATADDQAESELTIANYGRRSSI